jgi:hypothetical protein
MQIATPESLTPVRADRSWCIWSTIESVQNDVPSVTAILETLVVVPLYWWFALRVGVLLPLLVSAAVAPLVLLRSEQAVALGVRLFERARNTSGGTPFERRILKIIALLISISFISVLIVIFDVDKNIKMFIAIPAIVIVGVAYMASLQLVEFLYCIELTSGRHITIF